MTVSQVEPGSASMWALIVVIGVGIFGIRLSFIQLRTLLDEFPPRVERALTFVPAAILAALVVPQLLALEGPVAGPGSAVGVFVNARAVAGGTAAVVAWRTRSMLATVGVGMGVLWGVRLLFG